MFSNFVEVNIAFTAQNRYTMNEPLIALLSQLAQISKNCLKKSQENVSNFKLFAIENEASLFFNSKLFLWSKPVHFIVSFEKMFQEKVQFL